MATYITRSTHGQRKSENQDEIQAELSASVRDGTANRIQEVSQRIRNETEERMREYDKANAMDELEVEVEEEEEEQIVAFGSCECE